MLYSLVAAGYCSKQSYRHQTLVQYQSLLTAAVGRAKQDLSKLLTERAIKITSNITIAIRKAFGWLPRNEKTGLRI